jgi:hypothetical protein
MKDFKYVTTGLFEKAEKYALGSISIYETPLYNEEVYRPHLLAFIDIYIDIRKSMNEPVNFLDVGMITGYTSNDASIVDYVERHMIERLDNGFVLDGKIGDIRVGYDFIKNNISFENETNINSIW